MDIIESKTTMYNGFVIETNVSYDEFRECPNNFGNGFLHSRLTKHSEELCSDDAMASKRFKMRVGYGEHGGCLWGIGLAGGWDTTSHGGVFIADQWQHDLIMKLPKNEQAAQLETFANNLCDDVTKWCNGDAYIAISYIETMPMIDIDHAYGDNIDDAISESVDYAQHAIDVELHNRLQCDKLMIC